MLSLLAPILVFGLVIFVHELGHFLAAKAVGVYAPRFSIGFGPALIRFRRGETEYIVAALPLGGYVRMASRLDEETAFMEGGSETENAENAAKERPKNWDPEAMIPHGPKPVPEHRWFESKPLWARLFIMIAGVTMNAILSIVVLTALTWHLGRGVVPTTVVGVVTAPASVPALAQLQSGDTIRMVNGKPVTTWNEIRENLIASSGSATIQTNRGVVTLPFPADSDRVAAVQALSTGNSYMVPAVIDTVIPGGRAMAAGLLSGDSIVAIDGSPVRMWSDLSAKVTASAEKPLRFDVVRAGAPHTLTITPKDSTLKSSTGADSSAGKIGAAARDISRREPIGLGRAVKSGTRETFAMAGAVTGFLKQLVMGEVSMKNLGGPIAITKASVSAARSGVEELFYLIALLSINVAVLNLLPIPILDGGQILINVIESAKGSPFSMRTREYILRFGLAAIALLFIVVMFNDTRGGISKLVDWLFK